METESQKIMGFIFACTNSSQSECLDRMLFGSSKTHGSVAIKVQKGSFLFLLNLETDILYGVFRAASEGELNIVPEAWKGNYPYQVNVEAIGEIVPLTKAKKLLKGMGLSRNSIMGKRATLKLASFFRPFNMETRDWKKLIFQMKGTDRIKVTQPRELNLLGKVENVTDDVEEIPILQATTLWDFPRQSYGKTPKGDNKYPGVTPAELIWNLVWRYTEPGDLARARALYRLDTDSL